MDHPTPSWLFLIDWISKAEQRRVAECPEVTVSVMEWSMTAGGEVLNSLR